MPSWSEILESAKVSVNKTVDLNAIASRKTSAIKKLSEKTGRNVITYYSSFLQRPGSNINQSINDSDMNAFMANVYKLDKTKGVDLILHTPGGAIGATEQIIFYLHEIFQDDVRAIIPQMSMSGGSIIAVSCKEIIMGKQSCLGPFDPQVSNIACQNMINEFETAVNDIDSRPASKEIWKVIFQKITPTFLAQCYQAISLTKELTDKILSKYNLTDEVKSNIMKCFLDNKDSKTHSRHLDIKKCEETGLNIVELESNPEIQDLVLTIHHCYMILFQNTVIDKIVENNNGACFAVQTSLPKMPPAISTH